MRWQRRRREPTEMTTTRSQKRLAAKPAPAGTVVVFHAPDPIAPWPRVRRGADRFPVRPLQHLVRAHQHHVGVDGVFGPETEAAVRAFQKSRGLVADGIVGAQTWATLVLRVKQGSKGDAVRAVQDVIRFHHQSDAPRPTIDGIFGTRIDAWIRGFQTAVGITPDGIVGPSTWRALISGMLAG
jgi:peptidoglycan hydrolase-like protein with peptidoglycan-binding domain